MAEKLSNIGEISSNVSSIGTLMPKATTEAKSSLLKVLLEQERSLTTLLINSKISPETFDNLHTEIQRIRASVMS